MPTARKSPTAELRGLLEEIRGQLADLAGRVARLENGAAAPPPLPAQAQTVEVPAASAIEAAAPAPGPPADSIPEDVLLTISACVAAFLGERVHIRQVRLVASPAWAQQGRVSIQASHRLH
jgi:methylmalonyl-CoA carboxyltransferase large subunit